MLDGIVWKAMVYMWDSVCLEAASLAVKPLFKDRRNKRGLVMSIFPPEKTKAFLGIVTDYI